MSLPLNGKTMQQHLETIIVPCEDEVKSNGGIKRKFKLRRMNHHSCSNYHRNIMIHHTKFLLLVMWIICIFITYGRSLTIFYCVYLCSVFWWEWNWHNPYFIFCFNASIIISFNCTYIILEKYVYLILRWMIVVLLFWNNGNETNNIIYLF